MTDRMLSNRTVSSSGVMLRTVPIASAAGPTSCFSILPNAPNRTFIAERFMALHISSESWKPEVPSSEPVIIWILFISTKPMEASDMPVVIALLNSYGGLADASMGFVLMNKIQIITGSLDGTSGFLLSLLMCRAMNRSAMNVLFGAFGKIEKEEVGPALEAKGTVRSITPDELAVVLDSARSVIVVPGYGMAVAQAQHGVSELAKVLKKRGIDVKYAI